MTLEHDLKRALRAEAPPAGFAARVMQRIEEERSEGTETARLSGQAAMQPRHWWRTAAASVTFCLVLGGYATHKVVEHRRGEQAKEQVLEAMRITSEKMRYAQQEVRSIGSND
ncbi:MAG TPA: hypothetical protein VF911_09305 [Thermoanaerobaculia bacterium]|jgi:hypothetical protein